MEVVTSTNQKRIYIEGNIASGKSTFLSYCSNNSHFKVLPETIEKWQNYEGTNYLELMYQNPKENTFQFQIIAQNTMFERENSSCNNAPILLLERSIYSEYYVFILQSYASGYLTLDQTNYLASRAHELLNKLPKPDLFIYFRVDPEICYERLKSRSRNEENGVTLEYLKLLHNYHENVYIINIYFQHQLNLLMHV